MGADAAAAGDWKAAGAQSPPILYTIYKQLLSDLVACCSCHACTASDMNTLHTTYCGETKAAMLCCAGAHYGRIVSGKPPFEELALLLVESGEPEALQVFLQTKLQVR